MGGACPLGSPPRPCGVPGVGRAKPVSLSPVSTLRAHDKPKNQSPLRVFGSQRPPWWRLRSAAHVSRPPSWRKGARPFILDVMYCEGDGCRPMRRSFTTRVPVPTQALTVLKGGPGVPLGPLSDHDRGIPHGGFPLGLPKAGGFAPRFPPPLGRAGRRHHFPPFGPSPEQLGGKGGPSRHTLENPHRPTLRFPHNQITHRYPSLTPLPAWLLARRGEEEVFLNSKKKKEKGNLLLWMNLEMGVW